MKTIVLILLFICNFLSAQNEANIWYFGNQAGMNFNGGAPTPLIDGAMNTYEGCASIADNNGSLLFYSNGNEVWDQSHSLMPNGSGLLGDSSSTQSSIFVPKPLSNNIYYVFTADRTPGTNGVHYSEVDLALNSGMGDVTVNKNIPLIAPTSEKITSVLHSNQVDIWVVTHLANSDAFYAYLITSAGVNTTPVISNTGIVHTGGVAPNIGNMKFSSDGTKLGIAITFLSTAEIADFDPSTGIVSNAITETGLEGPYGVEFSPDNSKVYFSSRGPFANEAIFQYDITLSTPAAIIGSKSYVYQSNNTTNFGAMQLGPDKKIYIANNDETFLGVINDPDSTANNCNYVFNGFYLGGKLSRQGLPNIIQSYFNVSDFTFKNLCFNDSTEFSILDTSSIDSVKWNFDDPFSGVNNTSIFLSPFHIFSNTGSYNVTLHFYIGGIIDSIEQNLNIGYTPIINLSNDTTLCIGEFLVLDAYRPNATYLWQDNSNNPTFNVTQQGTYWTEVTLNNCNASDTILVNYNPLPLVNLGNDTILCSGESFILNATTPNVTYLWQNNSTTPTFTVTQQGSYWVQVSDSCGSTIDTIIVNYNPIPTIDLGNDTTLCEGEILVLDETTSNATYLWQDNSTNTTFNVTIQGTYWTEVTTNNCRTVDTILVNYAPLPTIYLGNDTTVCQGEALTLNATTPNVTYLWQNNSTTPTFTVTQQGSYWVQVSDSCGSTIDTIIVNYNPIPTIDLGNDTTLCEGEILVLDATTSNATYLWQDNSTNPTFNLNQQGTYWVQILDNCGSTKDTILINYNPLPTVKLGNDTTICEGEILILNATTPNATYLWQNNSTNPTFSVTQQGIYWAEVTVNNCSTVNAILVNYNQFPSIELGNDTTLCEGEILVLDATTSNATYLWQDNSTSPTFNVNQQGSYWTKVTVNSCGIDSDTIIIDLLDCNCIIHIPNSFTPNFDQKNDLFFPIFDCDITEYKFTILNRWGELVFETSSQKNSWNGRLKGKKCPTGVYIYTLKYKYGGGYQKKYGHINLLK
jgi:gliding motility-associated-like protein